MKIYAAVAAALPAVMFSTITASALESGIETYLLGSRSSMSGVLPQAGTYWNNDFVFMSGSAPELSIAGVQVSEPEVDIVTYKLNVTHVFEEKVGNATFAVNVNLPYATADLDVSSAGGINASLSDSQKSFGDLTVSPIFGWNKGNLHTTLATMFFLPTGEFEAGSVSAGPPPAIDMLNTGKGRFAFDPTLSMTWFNPLTGWEFSGAFGVTFSAYNDKTDYQTAPEAHFEGAVMRHLPNKLAVGMTGYAYHQIGEDSGAGADAIKGATGASSLQAEVYGIGPMVTYSTMAGKQPVMFKAMYINEFGAKRRFESDKLWLTAGLVF